MCIIYIYIYIYTYVCMYVYMRLLRRSLLSHSSSTAAGLHSFTVPILEG